MVDCPSHHLLHGRIRAMTSIDKDIFRIAVEAGLKSSEITEKDIVMIDHLLMQNRTMTYAQIAKRFKAWREQ